MARFERPGADECAPYYRQYLDLVPASVTNILNHLKVQGQATLTLMRGLDDKAGEARYAPGKWTVKEVVGHLIDTERVFAFRALWIARGATDPQPGMDENTWAAVRRRRQAAHGRALARAARLPHRPPLPAEEPGPGGGRAPGHGQRAADHRQRAALADRRA